MTTSIIPCELYNSVSPYYEDMYGSLSSDIYELTTAKAQHYLDNYDELISDLENRRNLYDAPELEDIQNNAYALSEFIEEWLVKTECLEEFSKHCDLPIEMYELVKTYINNL